MERTQFTFYESFLKAVSRIKNKNARCDAYDTICRYAMYGEEPDMDKLPDAVAIAFELVKPNLDASRRKANNGRAGGMAKQTASKTEANEKQTASKKEKEIEIEIEKELEVKRNIKEKTPTRFTPPSLEEVKAYCEERRNKVDPEKWFDHYSANGWKVGKNPMKDWKASVRYWERDAKPEPQKYENPFDKYIFGEDSE